jgi:hypothetical protein
MPANATSRLVAVIAMLLTVLAIALAPSAQAAGGLGPSQTVHQPEVCGSTGTWNGDAGAGGDGVTKGFASYMDGACVTPIGYGHPIAYFERSGSGWRSERTPYVGTVLAVAVDVTGTYLLYNSEVGQPNSGLRITKRLANGTFTGGRELAPGLADDGDLIVSGGAWWAVWSQGGPNGTPGDLYQARTMVSAQASHKITSNPSDDVAVYRAPNSRTETTFVTWVETRRDWTIVAGSSRDWARRTDIGKGLEPHLRAVSSANYLIAYETAPWQTDYRPSVRLHEASGFIVSAVSTPADGAYTLLGLTQRDGRATVVYGRPGASAALLARTQQ